MFFFQTKLLFVTNEANMRVFLTPKGIWYVPWIFLDLPTLWIRALELGKQFNAF